MKKQMICISGNIAVGKTEVAALVAEKLGFSLYKASTMFRQAARDNNMDLVTFNEYVKSNKEIDMQIENKTKEYARNNDKCVIDARLGFLVSENSFKVYITAELDIAAKRLEVAAKSRGKEEEYSSFEEAKVAIEKREHSERERYLNIYNVDIHNLNNYDYIIDTTHLTSKEVADKIIEGYNIWKNSEDC